MVALQTSNLEDVVQIPGAGESHAGMVLKVTQPLRTVQFSVRFRVPALSVYADVARLECPSFVTRSMQVRILSSAQVVNFTTTVDRIGA